MAGVATVAATIALAAYLWLFEVRGRIATLSAVPFGPYVVTQHQRRTSRWLPWLPTHELEVSDASGPRWRIRVRDATPWDGFGASHWLRHDELLVEDGDTWHGHDLATGALRWRAPLHHVHDARVLPRVTLVLDGHSQLWAIDHTSGVARWARDFDEGRLDALPTLGDEIVIGTDVVDLGTGRVRLELPYAFAMAGDQLFWAEGDVVMRRPAGAPPRRVLSLSALGAVDALAVGDEVLIHLSRIAQWAPDVAVRAQPTAVRLDELTARDAAIVALGPHDDVRWTVAMAHGFWRWCAVHDPRSVVVVQTSRAAGPQYVDAAFAIDVETGTVLALDASSACP